MECGNRYTKTVDNYRIARPCISSPLSLLRASSASLGSVYVIKANPLERPVSRSMTILASTTDPYLLKASLRSSSVVYSIHLFHNFYFSIYHEANAIIHKKKLTGNKYRHKLSIQFSHFTIFKFAIYHEAKSLLDSFLKVIRSNFHEKMISNSVD